ncbi:MAG TPA: cytochrome P450 [Acidimicrobiales bacterium]|nr:cytochrome P450 [Acidimicrobiales bacterium]
MAAGGVLAGVGSIDLTDYELWRHGVPHDLLTRLRREAPVWRHPATSGTERIGGSFWLLSRHDDVQAASRDHVRLRSLEGPSLAGDPGQEGMRIVAIDPPQHTRLRRLISAGFTPRMTAALEDRARTWAVQIIEAALERGTVNFVQEVAYQLPMHMIADIVGIPESDRSWLFERAKVLLQATDPRSPLTPEERREAGIEMFVYADELAAEKRRSPTSDVWTTLTTAEIEQEDGSRTGLSELELDLFFMVLVFAGSETTRSAIAGGLLALLEHPDQLARLRSDPGVLATAPDEIIRWTSPVTYFKRTATEDLEIRGQEIEAGERVVLCYASANRDEDVFTDPFRFDIARRPNPQVSFGGGGVHYCLGANLAKREVRVLFEELVARVADIELVGTPGYSVQGIENPITVALEDLPVRLTPR